ncbi:MAG: hypothetical protein ACR2RE_13030 [Geminicoccaceae bacterium]
MTDRDLIEKAEKLSANTDQTSFDLVRTRVMLSKVCVALERALQEKEAAEAERDRLAQRLYVLSEVLPQEYLRYLDPPNAAEDFQHQGQAPDEATRETEEG